MTLFLPSSIGILTAVQRQTAVTAYFSSQQLLFFAFELHDSLSAIEYWHTDHRAKTNSSNCLLFKSAVTAVCLLPAPYNDLHPTNTARWANVGLMLGQRRRRWRNIKPTLAQRAVLPGMILYLYI